MYSFIACYEPISINDGFIFMNSDMLAVGCPLCHSSLAKFQSSHRTRKHGSEM